jgi:Tol biopolymer transport system component
VDVDGGFYYMNWETGAFDLLGGATYRVSVWLYEYRLGFADVQFGASGQAIKTLRDQAIFPLNNGRTLPIKFHIQDGAVSEFVVDQSGGQVVAEDGDVVLDLPSESLTEPVAVTVQPLLAPPEVVPETMFDFGPDGQTFEAPVELTISYDETLIGGADEENLRIHKLVDGVWEFVPGGWVDPETNQVKVEISSFSQYAVKTRPLQSIKAAFSILYSSTRIGSGPDPRPEIWGIYKQQPVVTGNPVWIKTGPGDVNDAPAVSPNGVWLAYHSNTPPDVSGNPYDWEIHVIKPGDPSSRRRLTNNQVNDVLPDWSPDGDSIVFQGHVLGGPSPQIKIAPLAQPGTPVILNQQGRQYSPDWHPLEDKMAYHSRGFPGDSMAIYSMTSWSSSGFSPVVLEHDPGWDHRNPDWSPDGKYIVVQSDEFGSWDLFCLEMSPLGFVQKRTRLTHTPEYDEEMPKWSPDGKHIAYQLKPRECPPLGLCHQVWVINADGSGRTKVTDEFANRSPTWANNVVW